MPNCAVKTCKNYTLKVKKKDGVSYFHFPRNEIERDKWRRIIARLRGDEFYIPNASSVICSNHFSENDMYITTKGWRRLRKTAIPSIKLEEVKSPKIGQSSSTSRSSTLICNHLKKDLRFCKTQLIDKIRKIKNMQKIIKRLKQENETLVATVSARRKQKDLKNNELKEKE